MDFIDEKQFILFNTVHDISVWKEDDMKVIFIIPQLNCIDNPISIINYYPSLC